MKWQESILAALFAVSGSTAALAQGTVGELLDGGAAKLSKEEVLATIVGANLSGPTLAGGATQVEYKADGTYSGTYQGTAGGGRGQSGGIFGKWTVDDGGKVCAEGSAGPGGRSVSNCWYYYRKGDELYAAGAGPSGVALKRTVKR